MDSERTFMKLMVAVVVFFGSVAAIGAMSTSEDGAGTPPGGASTGSGYTHEELQNAASMTQQMSAPDANTGSPGHNGDEQLARSGSPGYVRAVEQHQADIDRMLAKNTR